MPSFRGRLSGNSIFNRASFAGTRRFIVIGGATLLVVGGVVAVSMGGVVLHPSSRLAKIPAFDPLPGGLHSDLQQDALAKQAAQAQAEAAARRGESFIPPLAASHVQNPAGNSPDEHVAHDQTQLTGLTPVGFVPPSPVAHTPSVNQIQPLATAKIPHAMPPAAQTDAAIVQVAAQTPEQKAEMDGYSSAVRDLLRGWDGKVPNTEVILSGQGGTGTGRSTNDGSPDNAVARPASLNTNLNEGAREKGRQLMPAGRGIYAHTVLAADSDSGGPIVLQADSGPFAGDRMIGSFSKAGGGAGTGTNSDRLVVRVNSIEHQGQTLTTDAIVIAPDTMETNVASSVDEHYLSRFVLPAAAAFVQGLGQALQTTSNTNGVLSPLGGASFTEQLNIKQQLGVAAGAAATQLGTTLNQQAPRGPTVHLDANSNVGVMFLTPVTENTVR